MRTPDSSSPPSQGGLFKGRQNQAFPVNPHISLCTQREVGTPGTETRAWLMPSSSTKARRAPSTHSPPDATARRGFSVIQPPALPVLAPPTLWGFSLGPSRRFSGAWRSFRLLLLSLHPSHSSENLRCPRSCLGAVPGVVVLFFNVLYLPQQENRLCSSHSVCRYHRPCHVFHSTWLPQPIPVAPNPPGGSIQPQPLSSLLWGLPGVGPLPTHPPRLCKAPLPVVSARLCDFWPRPLAP